MIVSAWNNGAFNETGAGYGVRVKKYDRDQFFQRARTGRLRLHKI